MSKSVFVRIKSPRVGPDGRLYRAGQKVDFPEHTAKLLLQREEAEPYIEGDPDYVPPEGTEVTLLANKTVLSQSQQPQKRLAKV